MEEEGQRNDSADNDLDSTSFKEIYSTLEQKREEHKLSRVLSWSVKDHDAKWMEHYNRAKDMDQNDFCFYWHEHSSYYYKRLWSLNNQPRFDVKLYRRLLFVFYDDYYLYDKTNLSSIDRLDFSLMTSGDIPFRKSDYHLYLSSNQVPKDVINSIVDYNYKRRHSKNIDNESNLEKLLIYAKHYKLKLVIVTNANVINALVYLNSIVKSENTPHIFSTKLNGRKWCIDKISEEFVGYEIIIVGSEQVELQYLSQATGYTHVLTKTFLDNSNMWLESHGIFISSS